MMPDQLSKQKYIYAVYPNKLPVTFHGKEPRVLMERYPVVYANEAYTYCKVGRQQRLCEIRTDAILDTLDLERIVVDLTRKWPHRAYLWEFDGDMTTVPDRVADAIEQNEYRDRVAQARRNLEAAKTECLLREKQLNELLKL